MPIGPVISGLARHHLGDLGGGPLGDRREAEVAVGDDAEQPVVDVDDGQAGDAVLAADAVELLQRRVGPDRDGVGDDPGLGALDQVDLAGLVLDRQVAVQHAEAALAGHRDRHPRLGDGVHRGADQRHPHRDLARQPRGRVDVAGREVGLPRQQQHVVVGEAQGGELLGDLHAAILRASDGCSGTVSPWAGSPARVWVAAAAALLARFPSLLWPLRPDEAGFLMVARSWDPGPTRSTGRYWVDRPRRSSG